MSGHYDRYNGMDELLGTNLAEVGTDCISRQQAIEECNKRGAEHIGYAIRLLPPIRTIQPKRGRWILDRSGAYCCSECMEPCASYVMMKPRDKYCKMCGSRNEVTE